MAGVGRGPECTALWGRRAARWPRQGRGFGKQTWGDLEGAEGKGMRGLSPRSATDTYCERMALGQCQKGV